MSLKILGGGGSGGRPALPLLYLHSTDVPTYAPVYLPTDMWSPALTTVNAAPPINRLFLHPLWTGAGGLLNNIIFETTIAAGAGGVVRHGFYASTGRNLPGALLFSTAPIATDGAAGIIQTNPAFALPAGQWVWMVHVFQVAVPTLRMAAAASGQFAMPYLGAVWTAAPSQVPALITDGIAGALPNPAAALAHQGGGNVPIVGFSFA